jgi:hypothetical protein
MSIITGFHPTRQRPPMANAQFTLPSYCFHFASGNLCVATPHISLHDGHWATVVDTEWMEKASAEDAAAMDAHVEKWITACFGKHETMTDDGEHAMRMGEAFLGGVPDGKPH